MGRKWAVSVDLRERAVAAYHDGEGSIPEIAAQFRVGEASLKRWLWRLRDTGSLAPAAKKGHNPAKVDDAGRETIRRLVAEGPDRTLPELTEAYNAVAAVSISVSTFGREVREMGLTRKKRPSQRRSATHRN